MKIFGIGLSRTGTTSLTKALNDIGINIIHYPSKQQLFDPTNDGACDIPVANYYKELDKRFPNSKFIYTIRDKKEWLVSMEKYLARKKKWDVGSWMSQNRKMLYGQMMFNKSIFDEKYVKHDNDIRDYFKNRPNDLLIVNICGGDTLEKLLTFTGISHVNGSNNFPHLNEVRDK